MTGKGRGSGGVACPRGHRIARGEEIECEAGHPHKRYTCRMRHGTAPCGRQVVDPPLAPGCEPDQ